MYLTTTRPLAIENTLIGSGSEKKQEVVKKYLIHKERDTSWLILNIQKRNPSC